MAPRVPMAVPATARVSGEEQNDTGAGAENVDRLVRRGEKNGVGQDAAAARDRQQNAERHSEQKRDKARNEKHD